MSQIKGRLTKDAEVRSTGNGTEVVNFTVAVNDKYKKRNGEEVERVEYFKCSYWFDSAMAALLKKGRLIDASGWISTEVYQKSGEHKAQLTMQVQSVKFPFVPKSKEKAAAGAQQTLLPADASVNEHADDLPF